MFKAWILGHFYGPLNLYGPSREQEISKWPSEKSLFKRKFTAVMQGLD